MRRQQLDTALIFPEKALGGVVSKGRALIFRLCECLLRAFKDSRQIIPANQSWTGIAVTTSHVGIKRGSLLRKAGGTLGNRRPNKTRHISASVRHEDHGRGTLYSRAVANRLIGRQKTGFISGLTDAKEFIDAQENPLSFILELQFVLLPEP